MVKYVLVDCLLDQKYYFNFLLLHFCSLSFFVFFNYVVSVVIRE